MSARTMKALALKRAKRLYGTVTPRLVEIIEVEMRNAARHAQRKGAKRKGR